MHSLYRFMDSLELRLQRAAQQHCGDLMLPHDLGLVLCAVIFQSDGREEERWIEDQENSCPHCGGSGHKGDIAPKESSE